MDEELIWGSLFLVWVISATIPYLYASVLSLVGKEAPAKKFVDKFGVPWVLTFGGLIVLWALEVQTEVAILYGSLVTIGAIDWANRSLVQRRREPALPTKPFQSKDTQGDEQMLLSKSQQYILIAVSSLIGFILIAQIGEEGLEDSPWMIGLLIIAGLLLLAFAPSRK